MQQLCADADGCSSQVYAKERINPHQQIVIAETWLFMSPGCQQLFDLSWEKMDSQLASLLATLHQTHTSRVWEAAPLCQMWLSTFWGVQNRQAGPQRVSCSQEEAEGCQPAGRGRVFHTDHKMSSLPQHKPCNRAETPA